MEAHVLHLKYTNMIYQSKFKGAQIDELLEKVRDNDVSQYALLNGEVTDDVDKQNQNLNITYISKGCVKYNDQLFNFDNNILTGFVDNQLKQYEINSETGEITEKLSIDIETLAELDARIKALESN